MTQIKKRKKGEKINKKKQKEEKIVGFKLGTKENKETKDKKVIIVVKFILCYFSLNNNIYYNYIL